MKNTPDDKERKVKRMVAWADLGSHNLPFAFMGGAVPERFMGLLHIWERKDAGLTRVIIEIPLPISPPKRKRHG